MNIGTELSTLSMGQSIVLVDLKIDKNEVIFFDDEQFAEHLEDHCYCRCRKSIFDKDSHNR